MAKAESKTILKAYSTVESKLPTLPLEDGQLIFVYDKKKIILDNHGVRTVYEQIQTIETEEQRNDLLAPIDSFYFVIETSILWRYSNGHWNQITTSPQEQIDRIATEGTKQVKAVQDKGNEVLQSIPEDFQTQMETKLNKQQGIENKGKVLVIGEDGNVAPGEVQSGGGDGIAIINTMSGESPLVIPDSAERVNKRLELGGKTEQVQTTGKNVWDPNAYADFGLNENSANSIRFENDVVTYISDKGSYNQIALRIPIGKLQIGDYKVSFGRVTCKRKDTSKTESGTLGAFAFYKDGVLVTRSVTFSVDDPNADYSMTCSGFSAGNNGLLELSVENPMISQISVGTYEPYTGGKPSPNPEYPQEILNAGRLNEDTGKYEVDVKVNGGNLFNKTNIKKGYYRGEIGENYGLTATIGYSYESDINIKPGTEITLSIRSNINTRSRLYAVDSNGIILYIYLDSNNNSADNSHTFTIPNGTRKILVSVLEISDSKDATITVNIGKTPIAYEPYKEQTLTLTSDRPITKWDRLVEQGGQIGWLYGSVIATINETTDISLYAPNGFYIHVKNIDKKEKTGYCDKLYTKKMSNGEPFVLFGIANNNFLYTLNTQEFYGKTASEIKAKLKEYPLNIIGKSETTEFVPLPQSEQNAIRALKTYYPTTVITVDGGELDPDIKVTYTADTKNYVDNKFGKTINAMQTKLLELESRV